MKTPLNDLCFQKVQPLYKKLTDDLLLSRCSRCLTQNANESLHSVIWNRCPKEIVVSKARVQLAASIAIGEYNLGTQWTVAEILRRAGLSYGQETMLISQKIDKKRVKTGLEKATEKYRSSRRVIALA